MADSQCPHLASCALYPLFTMKATLSVWQTNYCQGDYARCERYQRSCRGEKVPQNLLPNGKLLSIGGKK